MAIGIDQQRRICGIGLGVGQGLGHHAAHQADQQGAGKE